MYSTSFRPTPYRDLHLGGLFNAYMNWAEARKSGGEFVFIVDDLWMELQNLWASGFPASVMVPRYIEDLAHFGMTPDRIEYSLSNGERHRWAVKRLGMRLLKKINGLWFKVSLGGPCIVTCNFGDRPWAQTPEVEGWMDEAAFTQFFPPYMACCVVDDIDFGITKWVAGMDLVPLWGWCLDAYRRLGYSAPQIQFHPVLKRSRALGKFSKSDASTLTIRQLLAVGYEPQAIVETLLECAYLSWEKGLQAITIPPDVLTLEGVSVLTHRNRQWEQLAKGEWEPGSDHPEDSGAYIRAAAQCRLEAKNAL